MNIPRNTPFDNGNDAFKIYREAFVGDNVTEEQRSWFFYMKDLLPLEQKKEIYLPLK